MDIPFVGKFVVRTGIAAVAFNDELMQATKGVTAKNHVVGNIFGNSNAKLNMQIKQTQKESGPTGGALRLTGDAEEWLKHNLNISLAEVMSPNHQTQSQGRLRSASNVYMRGGGLNRYSSMRPQDLKQREQSQLTEAHKAAFDKQSQQHSLQSGARRPMSAATRSIANSFVSRLPQVNRLKIRMIMESIFKNRQAITEALNQSKHGLRNVISSSEILKVLKQSNIFVEIVNVKQLLQELGFSFNGPACSFLDLFAKIKATLQGFEQNGLEVDSRHASHVSAYSGQPPVGLKANLQTHNSIPQIIAQIKNLFYASRKRIDEIFKEAKLG